MNWLRNFMTGRYGGDQLSIATLVLYLILSVINMFAASPIVLALSYVLVFVWAFRFFSRNIYKRQAENRKFLQLMQPFSAMITLCGEYKWQRADGGEHDPGQGHDHESVLDLSLIHISQTIVHLGENSTMQMDTVQIRGIDSTKRDTRFYCEKGQMLLFCRYTYK